MTVEAPEQRRERLAQVVRQNIDLGRLGNALQVARDVADAIIASDEGAGLVCVPKSECADLASLRERLDVLLAKTAKE